MDQAERETPLKQAWKRFAQYDFNAIRQQGVFNRLLWWLLALGVLSTLLALVETQLKLILLDPQQSPGTVLSWLKSQAAALSWLIWFLHYPVLVTPIMISVLLVAANRLKPGKKWVLLRGSAEAIKREIFSYRAQAGIYGEQQAGQGTKESLLSKRIEEISQRLMQTEVNVSAMRSYRGPIPPEMSGAAAADDGLSTLTAEQYVNFRIKDQLNYFEVKIARLEKRLHRSQWAIYIFGGIGTLLAAVGYDMWVALTITVSGILTSYVSLHNIEDSLMVYNQAQTDLENVHGWWVALSDTERGEPENVDKLVTYTEKILEGELTGWVQHMQDALAELRDPRKVETRRLGPTV